MKLGSVPSKNQYELMEKIPLGRRFLSSEAGKLLNMRQNHLGGLLSGMLRSGYIKAIYRQGREIYWERVK